MHPEYQEDPIDEHPSRAGRKRMTYEEFLAAPEVQEKHAEWVDGEVIEMTPASAKHQRLARFVTRLFEAHLELFPSGELFYPPFQMKTGPGLPGREPDLLFIREDQRHRIKENYLDGPADLVVEIISDDSRIRDKREKMREYESGGVLEYWTLDSNRQTADFYILDENGRYSKMSVDANGFYKSAALPNLWLNTSWFWEEPFRTTKQLEKEWGRR
jgi:Uma2 family endonuclease